MFDLSQPGRYDLFTFFRSTTMSFALFRKRLQGVALAFGVLAGLAAPAPALAELGAAQRTEIEGVIKDYLMRNPDVIREVLVEMERKQKADEESARSKAVSDLAPQLFESSRQAVLGNPNGKITLVEFFDYNCGYCKKALDDVAKLVKAEPDLRLVIKDFPVLGPGSVEAAEVATAMRNQAKGDKYWQYHTKLLLTRGQIGKAQALAVAKELGADMDRLAKETASPETRASLQEVMMIADKLQLTGTPTFVLGDEVIVGAVGQDELRARIGNMRKCGKTACG
jgi:protein-disulfide isomerase